MKFRQLPLRCACGLAPARIKQVGFTPAHQLVIHWRCTVCKRHVYVVKDLADGWPDCPKPAVLSAFFESSDEQVRKNDAEFLHCLGVKFADEADSAIPS